jgi:hypothetical protein
MLLCQKICIMNFQENEYSTDTNNLEWLVNQSDLIYKKIKLDFKSLKRIKTNNCKLIEHNLTWIKTFT